MSKVTDEQVEAAAKAFEIDRYANPSSFKSNMRAALEAASSTPDGEVVRRKTFDEGAAMIFIKPLEWERHDSAMPRGPYASRIVAHAKAALAFHYTVHEHAQGPQKFEVFRGLGGERGASLEFYSTIDATKAAARADFDARILSCLSPNAGEIEAGGEVAEPTRYDMVTMTGSLTLLPAVRANGEWVRYADHEASIASAIAGFDRLAATQNGIVHQITARADAADKRIAELTAALKPFADALNRVDRGGPDEAGFIGSGLSLGELRAARAALKESRL